MAEICKRLYESRGWLSRRLNFWTPIFWAYPGVEMGSAKVLGLLERLMGVQELGKAAAE